jgi:Fe-S oxidoreductase
VSSPFSSDAVAQQLDHCTYCPKMCRHACPVSTTTGKETWIPQAKMALLGRLRNQREVWDTETTEALWACTGCRHCTMYCEHENEPGLVLLTGRREAVTRGAGHPALGNWEQRFHSRDERLGQVLSEYLAGHDAQGSEVGYFPGCDTVDKNLGEVEAALRLFRQVGAKVEVISGGGTCAGYPLLAAGHQAAFRAHAVKVAAELQRYRTVVVNCSACVYTLRAQYPAEGVAVPASIVAVPEFVAACASRLKPPGEKRAVYYHDPCFHARYNGVTEAPRKLLAQVAEVRELSWNGCDTECCGGAGLLPKTMPAVADAMARRRLGELAAGGGGLVVTSCGTCTFMLRSNAPASVEVVDLATALVRLGGAPSDAELASEEVQRK